MTTLKDGFFKVYQSNGSYVTATFFNPETKEEYSELVRDYDYDDCSRDNDELYYMEIDENAKRAWKHHHGVIQVGDVVEVFKGRKIPVGTKGIVVKEREVRNCYWQWFADYIVLDNGASLNVANCRLAG